MLEIPTLTIVIPCFNEQEVLPFTIERVCIVLDILVEGGKVSCNSSILFIDDGSNDDTWSIIEDAASHDCRITGILPRWQSWPPKRITCGSSSRARRHSDKPRCRSAG